MPSWLFDASGARSLSRSPNLSVNHPLTVGQMLRDASLFCEWLKNVENTYLILIWIYLVSILCVTGSSDVFILVVKGSLVRKLPSYEQRRSSWEKRYLSQIQPAKWSLSKEISHSSDSSIYSFIHPSVHAFIRDSLIHGCTDSLVYWFIE